ncbi:MAG: hypothetical protein ACI4GW_08895 [Lachnospiraceae bacterium]
MDDEKNRITLRNVEGAFSFEDILPVAVNGMDDKDIYYDPIVAASVVGLDGEIPSYQRDSSIYYMESLRKSFNTNGESYYSLIQALHLNYVNEIQHHFPTLKGDLKIHYHLSGYVNHSNIIGKLCELGNIYTDKNKEKINEFEEQGKHSIIYIRKSIDEKKIIASSDADEKWDYYMICKDENMAIYIRFFINSSIGKLLLLPDFKNGKLKGKTSFSQLKKLPVYYIHTYANSCMALQTMIDFWLVYDKKTTSLDDGIKTAICNYFNSLRDSLVLEMILPELFVKSGVRILKHWKEEIEKLTVNPIVSGNKEEYGLTVITALFDSLMASGNELMENLNRLRLYMNDFMNFANKIMSERK